jgi:predicted secreted hydrolase
LNGRRALGCVLLLAVLGGPATADFRRAEPGYRFRFPRDHGAHPDFALEWWYFTGHLWSADGARRYGYQLTFFRKALATRWSGSPAWRTDQFLLAHAALTQAEGGRFRFEERFNREGIPAGASPHGLDLRDASWSARADRGGRIHLSFSVQDASLELDLTPATPPVVFGEDGVSRKGADPAAASHYLSFPRLATAGTLRLPGRAEPVRGQSWMDHEFSSSQLAPGQVGWDWAGIQLRDGRSLMVYRLRSADGAQDPWSELTEVDAAGRVLRATRDFRWTGGPWRSPESGATYPLPSRLQAWDETWTLEPLVADQELRTRLGARITYWEGACRVLDGQGREEGDAYVELTGYAHSMQGRF